VDAFDIGANRKHWPLGLGYDRFYGFIGGETKQWYPELIEDNHFVEQPSRPEDGYHFSKDIADKAIGLIRDTKQSRPDKPWYMWYCPGANHAPHHAPRDTGDPVSKEYPAGFAFTGGQVFKVIYDIADDAYVDLERRLAAIMARD